MTCGSRFLWLVVNTYCYGFSKAMQWKLLLLDPFFLSWLRAYLSTNYRIVVSMYFIRVPQLMNCSSRRWSISASTDVGKYGSQSPSYRICLARVMENISVTFIWIIWRLHTEYIQLSVFRATKLYKLYEWRPDTVLGGEFCSDPLGTPTSVQNR